MLDEFAQEIRKLLIARHGEAAAPAAGRIDHKLHALLGLVPLPTTPQDEELIELAILCLQKRDPEVAAWATQRWQILRRNQPHTGEA